MRIAILGPLQVERGGTDVPIAGLRLRSLLARLALDAGRVTPASTLVSDLWRDELPADEANALQSLVSRLRRALGDPGLIQQSPGGYRLAVDRDDVDAHRFEREAEAGRAALTAGDAALARERLRAALAEWRGDALADLRDAPYAEAPAVRLDGLRLATVELAMDAELALGAHAAVVGQLEALAREHPLRERIAGQLMTALAGVGRQADALAVYERTRRRLDEELGVDPSPQLQAGQLAVLRGEIGVVEAEPARLMTEESAARPQLRAQLTSFVGRDEEVERVETLLETNRLVEIIGPGGAGKTRLAVQIGEGIGERLGGVEGVWLVELAAISDPAVVAHTVLSALGLRESNMLDRPTKTKVASLDAQSRLVQALRDQRAVVLMDNCEHVIGAAADLVDYLLARCPGLRVLATSREPLGIVGETLCVIPPLEHPAGDTRIAPADALAYPAVRLFADRAASARRGFAVEEANVARVVEICRRLDGLPLAIELAAARLRSLSIDQVAGRLDDRFRLLSAGNRTALPRQRTLRAVVEWSWDLLSPTERLTAENLAVFPGGLTAEAAVAVCAAAGVPESDVVDLLAALVDKSLLQLHDEANLRYRMLETIREFGVDRLAERNELTPARGAHARYFAAFAAQAEPHLRAAEQIEWLRRMEVEKGNVLAALRFLASCGDAAASLKMTVDLSMMWMLQGRHEEFASWSSAALAADGEAPPLLRAIVEVFHALNSAITTGQFDTAGEAMQQAKPVVMGAESNEFLLLPFVQGLVMMFSDDADGAEEVIERHRDHPEPWVRAGLHLLEAGLAENAGDVDREAASAAVALDAFLEIGDRWGCAGALDELASARKLDGDLDGAIEAYQESMRYARELGAKGDIAETMLKIVDVRVRQGDLRRAGAELADVQRALAADPGLFPGFARMFVEITLGWLRILTGAAEAGREAFGQALERYRREGAGHPKQLGVVVLGANAEMAIDDGDLARARSLLAEARVLALEAHDMPVVADFGRVLAQYAGAVGRAEDGAAMLGAGDRLRGRPDVTHPRRALIVDRLRAAVGAEAFDAAYAAGAALDGAAAIARLDLAALPERPW